MEKQYDEMKTEQKQNESKITDIDSHVKVFESEIKKDIEYIKILIGIKKESKVDKEQ